YVPLQKRFTACDLDKRTFESEHAFDDLRQRHFYAGIKGVGCIAIGASQIAERQTHKNAWQPRPGALPLDRAVNLINGKSERCVLHECGQKRRRVRQKNQCGELALLFNRARTRFGRASLRLPEWRTT